MGQLLLVRFRIWLALLVLVSPCSRAQESSASGGQAAEPALEIRLTTSPIWKDYCLQVSLQRVNHSKSLIFLPSFNGVLIYSSVIDTSNTLGQGNGLAWLPVYGSSDIVSPDVSRLPPGEEKQNLYCIPDTFPVVDAEKKLRRQVRLQGKLRIYAGYYLEAPKWQISKAQREKMAVTSPDQWKNADIWSGSSVSIEIAIPCPAGSKGPDCSVPPPIFQGEHRPPIPDIGK